MSNGIMGWLVVIPEKGRQEIHPLSREHTAINGDLIASVEMGLKNAPFASIRKNNKGDQRYMLRIDFSDPSHDPPGNLGTNLRFKFCKTEADAKAFRCKGTAPLKR